MVSLRGGYFNIDPAAASYSVLAAGYRVAASGDAAYPYRVEEIFEAVARVTTAGGVSTDYNSLRTALVACTEGGETVTMLANETFSAAAVTSLISERFISIDSNSRTAFVVAMYWI